MRLTNISWVILSAAAAFGANLDVSVVSQMRLAVPGANQARVIARLQAAPELDVVVTLAGTKEWPPGQNHRLWWDEKRVLGIFLQRRDHADTVYEIAIQRGTVDCELRVERATATDLVASCRPEKGDLRGHNYKFFYDIRSKALIRQLEYHPFSMPRLFASEKEAVLVGSDRKRLVAAQFDGRNGQDPFRLLDGPAAERWTERANARFGLDGFGPTSEQIVDVPVQPFRTRHFGPGARFSLVNNPPLTPNSPASGSTVLERLGTETRRYPLAQTTYDSFARQRPARVRDGYKRAATSERLLSSRRRSVRRKLSMARSGWQRLSTMVKVSLESADSAFSTSKRKGTSSTLHLKLSTGPRALCWLNPKQSGSG